jgi:hypothetical protein
MSKEKRGFIAGNRIVGDIGGISSMLDPVSQAWPKLLMPAVNLTGIKQEYDEQSVTQNYELGSHLVVDERVFHYARAGAALVAPCTYRLQVNADINSATTWGLALAAPIVAGDTTVQVASAVYQAGTIALDELKGGWIEVWGAANVFMWRRILGNTAAVGGAPAAITITVDRPFNAGVIIAGNSVALHHNNYYNVQMGGSVPAIVTFESAVGLTPIPVTNGRYFWLQTWGPCFIASQLGNPGAVLGFRDVYYGAAGTLLSFNAAYAAGANVSPQRIGYISGASTNADGNNDVNLQLAP